MRLDTSIQQQMKQEMRLSPQLYQLMEILQLSLPALEERIEEELQANPVLEMQEPSDSDSKNDPLEDREWGESALVVDDGHGNKEDFSRLDDLTHEYGEDFANPDAAFHYGDEEAGDRKLQALANTPQAEPGLDEYLLQQWAFLDEPEPVNAAGIEIINHIDEDGYFRISLDELANHFDPPLSKDVMTRAIAQVQTLEPTGVGATDLRECLLLQLAAKAQAGEDVALAREMVASFLKEIEMNRLPLIARRTGQSIENVKAALSAISRLDPHPGRQVVSSSAPTIQPDVYVTLDENEQVIVTMPEDNLPELVINAEYARKARDRSFDKAGRHFLQKNIRSGQWIIDAIAQRRHTIRRVTEEIFKVQKDFLLQGPEALKPLPMAQIADAVGVHVATVSRAVAEKHVQTPRGLYPLRMFFSGGTTTADGDEISWDAVKIKLQEIVDKENKAKPLSDDALAKALQAEGIDIARRTVAKYRGILNIPPARKRKEF